MNLSTGILAGLVAMFGWGIADFLAASASRKIGNLRTLFWMLITSFLIASVYFLATPQDLRIPPQTLLILALVGLLQVIAFLAFYRGFELGLVSVVSPLGASYALIVVLASLFFLKENLIGFQPVGVFLILLGVPLISISLEELKKFKGKIFQKGVREGLLAMFGWGFSFFLLVPIIDQIGWFLPIYLFRLFAIIFLTIYGLIFQKEFRIKELSVLMFLVPIGILDIGGFFAASFGVLYSLASIVAPISAAFPLVTVLLARIFFRERLVWNQVLGIAAVITGLVFLSL